MSAQNAVRQISGGKSANILGAKDGKEREFEFSKSNFEYIKNLVKQNTGINLTEAKQQLVYSRLARRLRALGLATFNNYTDYLESNYEIEIVELTNAITTNLTSFFREGHHFEFMSNTFLPDIYKQKKLDKTIRIWSAGCSTGEEPYSIAMTLKENMPSSKDWDIKVLATDLDTNVVEKARSGVYADERIAGMKAEYIKKWFIKGTGEQAGNVKISSKLQELITFKQLNLMDQWPMKGKFDLIFCRNVVIYFDKPTQKILFDRYAEMLTANGYMIVGHSENLFKVTDRFELLGKTIYRKLR